MTIEISKMIVHKLNINGPLPILSNSCIDIGGLEDPQEALDFFTTHIEQSKKQEFVKKCQFWGLENNTIKINVQTIFSKLKDSDELEQALISESQKMAKKFTRLIKGTSSKSDGSLFVFLYSDNGENNIAIMKMDPDTGVEVRNDLTIVVRKDMLPSKREKLHKAAFIKYLDDYEPNQLHLYVLDRQKNSDEPAKFFMRDFLNVKELPDDENLTTEYQKVMTTIFQDVLSDNVFLEFSNRFQTRLKEPKEFILENDFPILIKDLLPKDDQDVDIEDYTNIIKHELNVRKPGEVNRFVPVEKKINNGVYKTRDNSIEIIINKNADENLFDISMEDGKLTLIVHPESGIRKIK